MQQNRKNGTFIAPGRKIWSHELHVAEILTLAGHNIEFIEESNLHTADILLDGIEFEIKSPKTSNTNSLEHLLKKALKQSPNIIIDTSRMKHSRDDNIRKFLVAQAKSRKQIKKLIMVTKHGQIIDISALI